MASKIIRSGFKSQIKQTFANSEKQAMPNSSNGIFSTLSMIKDNPKDSQKSYWEEDFRQPSLRRSENKGPKCSFNSVSSVSPVPSIPNTSTSSLIGRFFDTMEATDDDVQTKQSAIAALTINRRILRSRTLQLLQKRRYSASTSRSTCNIFQRHDDRRRVTKSRRIKDAFEGRTLSTGSTDKSILGLLSTKCLEPLRNQNMSSTLGSLSQAARVSSMIQEELMPIDKSMRERISVKNPPPLQNDQKEVEPLANWYHPPSPEILSNRIIERLAERRHVPPIAEKSTEAQKAANSSSSSSNNNNNTPYRKRRLDQQCKEPTENPPSSKANAAILKNNRSGPSPISKKKVAAAAVAAVATESQSRVELPTKPQAPIAACDSVNVKENVSNLTARRVNNIHQGPVRRFSLRRPPKNNVPEILPPAPGPAAESLNQIKSGASGTTSNPYNGVRPSPSLEFNLKRYSGTSNWF